ncbi:MAG: malonyl-ACP O-methyltransferase BioC [bacterium]
MSTQSLEKLEGAVQVSGAENMTLKVDLYREVSGSIEPPLVLIHGWGSNSQCWDDFLIRLQASPTLQRRAIYLMTLPGFDGTEYSSTWGAGTILDRMAECLPETAVLVGWSLGGMLATAYAAQYPVRVSALICLATNASYIQRDGWPRAVPPENLAEFIQVFEDDAKSCLRRFRGNQVVNDQKERDLLRQLVRQPCGDISRSWVDALDLLSEIDNRSLLSGLQMPSLWVFGREDAMVPSGVAKQIARQNERIRTEVLDRVSHVIHLSEPEKLCALVEQFLDEDVATSGADKRLVAESFSRSAASYDSAAKLQRAVGERLIKLLPRSLEGDGSVVIDLGCGTGYFLPALQEQFPSADIFGLDIAEGMLQYIHNNQPGARLCGADAEQLPLADNSVDIVYSNLAIQWCSDPATLSKELSRVLKPGGIAVMSTLVPGTLRELQAAWRCVDDLVHVNEFVPEERIRGHVGAVSLEISLLRETRIERSPDIWTLSRELKALGAHNMNRGRPSTFTGKGKLKLLAEAYDQFRLPTGEIPVTWELLYLTLRKPAK